MLQRFFRPRWQHTDPSVRLRAVATLDPQQDHDTLMLLARGDASVEVRCAAVARLRDPQLLEDYAHQDSHTEVRAAALTRLQLALTGSVADGLSAENRLRFIGLTSMPAVLLHVALHGQEPALRLAALQRIQDEDALLTLALDASDVSLRIQAAERIHDDDRLRRLARDGRDKKVVRLARERLKTAQQAQQAREQQRQQWQEWLEHLRTHSQRQYDNLYEARLQQLKQRGENLLTQATSEEREQAQSLLQACQQRIDAHLEEQRHAEACVAAQREQAGAVDTLESTLSALDHHDDWPSANSLGAMLASQQRRWQEAIGVVAADNKLTQRYDSLNARWQALISHWQNWQTDHTSAWPADLPTPPALRVHTEAATPGAAAESTAEQNDLDRTLAVLTNALRRRQLRLANRLWHKLESSGEQLTGAQRARMERLAPDLAELRDWHAFAAEPKKLQLCEEMEALANKDMPARDKADTIQLLHDRWRELMSADQEADQALWDRFRAASDVAWAPCREHFAELDRERSLNLARRQQLCDQLAHYLDTLDPATVGDWAPVAEIRRTAPQEWKQYQPVRFTDARETSRQFSALLKRLDTLLDEVASRHTAAMEDLIREAEQLAASDDPRDAAERCKQLQSRWQQVGWVPVSSRRKLYKRFRQHADTIFARLQASRDAMRQQYQQQGEALRQALQQLQRALDANPDEHSLQALTALASQIADMPCPPREEKLLQQRDQMLRQARARRQKWPQWQRWSAVRQRLAQLPEGEETAMQRELAVAMEVATGIDSPPAARELRMQWQLQHLGDAMKSQNLSPLQRCTTLLDNSPWLDEGVSPDIRERLLAAWQTQEPER